MQTEETAIKPIKLLLPTLLVLSLIFVTAVPVNAQEYPHINSEILPSQGGANTPILLQFLTTDPSVGNVTTANIYWDNNTIAFNQPGSAGANGAYNYNVTVPNEPPLSSEGNHTIRVDSSVTPYGAVSFYFSFNITEFVPSPEYLALNDTYYSLLANYTNIFGNYTQLQASFNLFLANYSTLLAQHNNDTLNYLTLESQYNQVNSNYAVVLNNYNLLTTNYGNLTTALVSLSSSYTDLQTNFQNLNSSYVTLIQDYNLLNSSYAGLLSNYNSVTGQLDFSRNLNYVLIIITIALAIATVYFVMLKPKKQLKTR